MGSFDQGLQVHWMELKLTDDKPTDEESVDSEEELDENLIQ